MDIMLIILWTLITIGILIIVCVVVALGALATIGAATISAFLDRD